MPGRLVHRVKHPGKLLVGDLHRCSQKLGLGHTLPQASRGFNRHDHRPCAVKRATHLVFTGVGIDAAILRPLLHLAATLGDVARKIEVDIGH